MTTTAISQGNNTTEGAQVSSSPNSPQISRSEYQRRQKAVFSRMKPSSIALIVGAPERTRSNDTNYAFRQSSDLLYLNGFPEPDAVLALVKDRKGNCKTIMFVRPKDKERETWNGFREGPSGAVANYDATEAHNIADFSSVVEKLLANNKNFYYKLGRDDDYDKIVIPLLTRNQKTILNPEKITHELRMFKSEEEILILRHIANISALAHTRAMVRCEPGMRERQLQATLEFTFADAGAEYVAYTSIVAGEDGTTLHYTTNHKVLSAGNLIVIDAGGEWQGYASDITRTIPVSGKFSEAQRKLYDLVLQANLAGIAMSKPGSSLNKIHARCEDVLRAGLVELGILSTDVQTRSAEKTSVEKAKKAGTEKDLLTLRDVFMHGTSHFMGLDVHDVCTRGSRNALPKARELKSGMVFTVEPGVYMRADDTRIPVEYRGIGIRIEDDVLITSDGNEVLTRSVTKDADEIEALMAK
jgi:Xaa-Pro aminopeptidase